MWYEVLRKEPAAGLCLSGRNPAKKRDQVRQKATNG